MQPGRTIHEQTLTRYVKTLICVLIVGQFEKKISFQQDSSEHWDLNSCSINYEFLIEFQEIKRTS